MQDCEVVLVEDMPPAMVKIMAKYIHWHVTMRLQVAEIGDRFREVEDTRRLRWERITSANAYNTLKGQLIERKDNAWDAQFSTSKDQVRPGLSPDLCTPQVMLLYRQFTIQMITSSKLSMRGLAINGGPAGICTRYAALSAS